MTDRIYTALVHSMLTPSPFQAACLVLGSRLETVAKSAIETHSASFPGNEARIYIETVHTILATARDESMAALVASNAAIA